MYNITLQELGVMGGVLPDRYLKTALKFFDGFMPGLSRADCVGYLKAIDLHAPPALGVGVVWLRAGALLAKYRYRDRGNLVFFTKAGTSPHQLGIQVAGRHFERYRVVTPCTVLRSRCADFGMAAGGGIQFIVPHADSVLHLVQVGEREQPAASPDVELPDWF